MLYLEPQTPKNETLNLDSSTQNCPGLSPQQVVGFSEFMSFKTPPGCATYLAGKNFDNRICAMHVAQEIPTSQVKCIINSTEFGTL